ncbi:hypothetical protein [Thermococcus sp.]|uniref:hypothetical protein n=1 Tax=Thermococcus sp. TaxID=35749 RepID=UPI00260489A5|nr:hypothetical protein [Thermococcus sp.]
MSDLPHLIPILFMVYVALGLAEPKTIAVSAAFAIFMAWGIERGKLVEWRDYGLEIDEKYIVWAFWLSLATIALQIAMLHKVPLLDPVVRTNLNPRLTALTYFLGVPSSVYLFMKGRRYSLLYPVAVALYAYRTPVVVSILALGIAYYQGGNLSGRKGLLTLSGIAGGGLLLFLLVTFLRGNGLSSLWVRIQSTVSVLDVIVWRGGWSGYYKGALQWAGVTSYFGHGYAPRGLVAKFLYVHTGATITPTLLGGMYLDFGVFALIEAFLLGLYYGMLTKAEHPITKALYYSTLAYGIVGIETGILDLPVYALFLLAAYILYRGWRVAREG